MNMEQSTAGCKSALGKWKELQERRAAERILRAEMMREVLRTRGTALFEKYGIRRAILFGSVAEGRCEKDSDLDLLVLPLEPARYWDFRYEPEEAVGFFIDLYTQDDDPKFVKKVMVRGETLYEISP